MLWCHLRVLYFPVICSSKASWEKWVDRKSRRGNEIEDHINKGRHLCSYQSWVKSVEESDTRTYLVANIVQVFLLFHYWTIDKGYTEVGRRSSVIKGAACYWLPLKGGRGFDPTPRQNPEGKLEVRKKKNLPSVCEIGT